MTYLEEIQQRFDEKFPCIQEGCDNNGSIPNQVSEDEWEQQQCQYCDEKRLPAKEFIKSELTLLIEKCVGELEDMTMQSEMLPSDLRDTRDEINLSWSIPRYLVWNKAIIEAQEKIKGLIK